MATRVDVAKAAPNARADVHDALALPRVPPPARADHPRRDAIVAFLFALAIALPPLALLVSGSRTTTRFENRPAAAWPEPSLARRDFRGFTTAFEAAFADRFGARDRLIQAEHFAKAVVFGVSPVPNMMIGRDGWLFFLGEDGRALDRHYRGVVPFGADVDALVRELTRRNDYFAARGTAYVVMIVPDKFTMYPEMLPAWVHPSPQPTPLARVSEALTMQGRVAFVDLRGSLAEAKKRERIYFMTDSHWNLAGAFVGYDALMRKVVDVLPPGRLQDIARVSRPAYVQGLDVYSGDLAKMVGLPQRFHEPDYVPFGKLLADSTSRCAKRTDHGEFPGFEFYACDKPGLPRAVVYRDSMAIPLIPLIAENFRRSVMVSSRHIDPALIAREKPDVVIDELVERSLNAPLAFPIDDRK
jgi:hypothetical protein